MAKKTDKTKKKTPKKRVKAAKKTAEPAKTPPKPAKKTSPERQITNANIKNLAFKCENMVDAAVAVNGNLDYRLTRSKALMAAWKRGRFLREIGQLAAVAMTKAEVATRMDIPLGEFERMLTDPEAAGIWTTAQINTLVTLKEGIMSAAIAGKGAAIKRFERILQEDRPDSALDIYRVSIDQMTLIAGVTRQTLNTWVTEKGLSRNGDTTFDLRVFIKWFEGFSQRKVNVTPQAGGEDSLRELKAIQLKNKIAEEISRLLPRDEVIAGFVGRLQHLFAIWDRLIDGVCDKCANLPKQGVGEILDKFKDELRSQFATADIEMKLTEEQQKEFDRFLKKLE